MKVLRYCSLSKKQTRFSEILYKVSKIITDSKLLSYRQLVEETCPNESFMTYQFENVFIIYTKR